MDIKSDATANFISEEVKPKKSKKNQVAQKTPADMLFWTLIMGVGGALMWVALVHPDVRGIIAFFVFFIGLNRVDAAIDYFRGIDDKKSVSEKDIL